MNRGWLWAPLLALGAGSVPLSTGAIEPYPLDGYARTGIRRLEAYRLVQEGKLHGRRLWSGALLHSSEIRLRLSGREADPRLDVTPDAPKDPDLQRGLEKIFRGRDPHYSIALLDITDPTHPAYAGLREDVTYKPGSVGKLVVLVGLFSELARVYPDTTDRIRVLRETRVTADDFIVRASHAVPIVDLDRGMLQHRRIQVGDTFTLWEWLDHMVSPSSNSAGSMVWKQAMLLRRFGAAYPPSDSAARTYFKQTGRLELQDESVHVINDPLRRLGIGEEEFRQGTFFTSGAQRYVPGVSSYASPRALLRFLVRLEQGRVIDRWSSLEIKKLLYFTRGRYRYASSQALHEAAVYFKSGSLYSCRPEAGFVCRKYHGNKFNFMNSVAIVESPARGAEQRTYLVALTSNVLRRNSAVEHRNLATAIEALIRHRPRSDRPHGAGSLR